MREAEALPDGLEPAPADLLRQGLTSGRGRLAVNLAATAVWVMDLLLARDLERDQVIAPALKGVVTAVEQAGTLLFVVVTLGLITALLRGHRRALFRWGLVYLCFSVLQVIANVGAMIFTAGHHQGGGLTSLWDVAAVYMESVLVFMFIYVFPVVTHQGGQF